MGQHTVRLAIVAGVVVGALLTAVVAAADFGSHGDGRVTITISPPCQNPQPLVMGHHAWASSDPAPPQWGEGSERGRFTVTGPGQAVFRSDQDGRQVTFHESDSRFTTLDCAVGSRASGGSAATTAPTAGTAGAVPSVIGMNVQDAADRLGTAGLRLETVHVRSASVPAGVVLVQSPAPATLVVTGDIVTLTVSDGP